MSLISKKALYHASPTVGGCSENVNGSETATAVWGEERVSFPEFKRTMRN